MTTASLASSFRITTSVNATSLTDGVALPTYHSTGIKNDAVTTDSTVQDDPTQTKKNSTTASSVETNAALPLVVMPWVGFGTYRIGKNLVESVVYNALSCGYRAIDTAFIYGGETTEPLVGLAIQRALQKKIIHNRNEIFVITKHWRKYHGYEPTLQCIQKSLQRLQLTYIDLYLMHWPGPPWSTMNREKVYTEKDPWHYSTIPVEEMVHVRAETWRAMEEAYHRGWTRSIGVSNMSIAQLQRLKKTATCWPPAVNQVEVHPLHPQWDLIQYCHQEGIVIQAYASLGGQDTGQKIWTNLLGIKASSVPISVKDPGCINADSGTNKDNKKRKQRERVDLIHAPEVVKLAESIQATTAQTLLRWGLDMGCAIIPKTSNQSRLIENAQVLSIASLSQQQRETLSNELLEHVRTRHSPEEVTRLTRLCWRTDPLRHLDFE